MNRLRFVQALAFLPACGLPACGGPQTPPTATPDPATSASASPSASASTVATVTHEDPPTDPTAGTGPCRCSWETNAAAAPRVCRKGEANHVGHVCAPGKHYPPYKGPIKGPLPPPDLPA